eukprot:PLAT3992.2.p2 GENE.PLAT3992.2~~PLAT3992.2.p2  ORF type:complete len:277 (-),score=78.88 PLAT3992.2:73-903(-)
MEEPRWKRQHFALLLVQTAIFEQKRDRAVLKEMIIGQDELLDGVLERFEDDPTDYEELRDGVVGAVVERTVRLAYDDWTELFSLCPLSVAKQLAEEAAAGAAVEEDMRQSFVYGEVDFFAFAGLLEQCKLRSGESFVDIGSGTGKTVVAAALLFGNVLGSVRGIEMLKPLNDCAELALAGLRRRQRDTAPLPDFVGVETADATEADWTDASVVFLHWTSFSDSLRAQLEEKAKALAAGARIIVLTHELHSSAFHHLRTVALPTSWGVTPGHLYCRR